MGRITLEDNSNQSGESSSKVATGAYLKKGRITSVVEHSNYPNQLEVRTIGANGFKPEICLEVIFKDDDFEKKLFLFGKFKKNSKDMITGWDSFLNNVQRLLAKLLGNEAQIEEDLSIPPEVLKKLEGKEFQYVNYQSNRQYETENGTKYSYSVWPKIFNVDEDIEDVKAQFAADLPYLKDYAPELVQKKKKEDESFNYGAN